MGVRAGAGGHAKPHRRSRGLGVEMLEGRLSVAGLDGIDEPLTRKPLENAAVDPVTKRVEGMRNVHEPALVPDVDRSLASGPAPGRDPLGQEEPDHLSFWRPLLLTDHHLAIELVGKPRCSSDRPVIRDAEDIDTGFGDGDSKLIGCRRRVAGPHRVHVAVHPHMSDIQRLGEVRVTG